MDVLALHARVARDFDRRDFESYLEAMHPEDAAALWLLDARGGLVWRYRPVESEDAAREEYARLAHG
jgi:hypothetical protein